MDMQIITAKFRYFFEEIGYPIFVTHNEDDIVIQTVLRMEKIIDRINAVIKVYDEDLMVIIFLFGPIAVNYEVLKLLNEFNKQSYFLKAYLYYEESEDEYELLFRYGAWHFITEDHAYQILYAVTKDLVLSESHHIILKLTKYLIDKKKKALV